MVLGGGSFRQKISLDYHEVNKEGEGRELKWGRALRKSISCGWGYIAAHS